MEKHNDDFTDIFKISHYEEFDNYDEQILVDINVEVVNENRNAKKSIYEGFYGQFENFVSLDVEPQTIEGFVYETETRIFKLTGAFQSLNRICGTARYQFGQLFPEE